MDFGIFIDGELVEDGFSSFKKALKCAEEDYEEDDYEICAMRECGSSCAQGACDVCDADEDEEEDE